VNDSILSGRPAAFQTSQAAAGAVVHDGSFPSWVGMNCCKATFWVHTINTVRTFFFFWIEFHLSFPTQHQLRTLLLLCASACSLSSHENLCSCGSPLAPNCVAHLRTLEVSSTKFWRVGLQHREFSFVGLESTFTAFYSASISVGSKLRAQSSQV
jgi:hypothetical protein